MPALSASAQGALLRAQAARTTARLQGLIARLPPQGPARPGELTVLLAVTPAPLAALFVHMACTAVHAKYSAAGRPRVAGELAGLRDRAARVLGGTLNGPPDGRTDPPLPGPVARCRLGAHATRADWGDPDFHLCMARSGGLGHGATPWACQQPDWRFRWTPQGARRLHFMAACWGAYALCDFGADDALIGLHDFPLSDAYRPEPCP